jgi:acyl-CoA thioesterase II
VPDLWTDLLECLDVALAPSADTGGETGVAVFEGRNQQLEYHRLFGGQLLGQFVQTARLTCPDKAVKSLHAVFARRGARRRTGVVRGDTATTRAARSRP